MVRETGIEPANPLLPKQVLYQSELLSEWCPTMESNHGLLLVAQVFWPLN